MSAIEKLLGAPMAAPETSGMRRFRLAVITLASTLAAGVLLASTLRSLLGPVVTGGVLGILLVATAAIAAVYFTRKARLDDAWLDQLVADDRVA